jgi:hypothetical protein
VIKNRIDRLSALNADEGKRLKVKFSELVALNADQDSLQQLLGEVNEAIRRAEKH